MRTAKEPAGIARSNIYYDMADAARDGQTALALRLAKLLAPVADVDATDTERNVAFSPLSIHAALALVAAGARGATQAQLLSFLGAPSAAELAAFGRRIADSVLADRADTGGPRVLFGGGVWVDESCGEIKRAFRNVAEEAYKSEARTVGFASQVKPEEAVEMINKFVKRATKDMITSIVSPRDISAETDLVLANAVYFKGVWLEQFSYGTFPGTFHRLDGSPVEAQFMSLYFHHYVSCMDGFKVLRLPYRPNLDAATWEKLLELQKKYPKFPLNFKGGRGHTPLYLDANPEDSRTRGTVAADADVTQYSMFIFLPDRRDGFATMVDVITAAPDYLYSVLPRTKPDLAIIKLPKFEISSSWDLHRSLSRLGLSLPFSPEAADLRGMFEKDDAGRPTFLTKIVHRAAVNVTEQGTEAAAATGSLRGGGLPPNIVEFVADRPFTFLIMEERSRVIVFAGHVLDPTK